MAGESILTVEALEFSYGAGLEHLTSLRDVSFTLRSGSIMAIVGPSGCGKTTLMKLLAELLKPIMGSITMAALREGKARQRIGFSFQEPQLIPWRTVEENLRLGQELCGDDPVIDERLVQVLELGEHLTHYPKELSGGLRERVDLGRVLHGDYALLLMDEPLSSTDYFLRLRIEDFLAEHVRTRDAVALMVTHDAEQAVAVSEQVLVLQRPRSTARARVLTIPDEVASLAPSEVRRHEQLGPLTARILAAVADDLE